MGDIRVQLKAQDVTYGELKALKDAGGLSRGGTYRITDFRTVYRRVVGFDEDNWADIWAADGRETDENPSPVEPLIVTAVTESAFAAEAVSALWPEDKIYFSFDEDMLTNKGYEIYTPESKGFIYRRVSKNKVDMPFDFRACKWRRWEVDYDAVPLWNGATVYPRGKLVRSGNVLFVSAAQPPVGTPPSGNRYWFGVLNLSDTKFLAPKNYDDWDMIYDSWTFHYEIGAAYLHVSVPLTGAFRDVFTFSKYDGSSEPNIDGGSCANNRVRGGHNFVFYSNGGMCRNNTIGTGCVKNTFASGFSGNTILNGCSENIVGKAAANNEIGCGFAGNVICFGMSNNVIGAGFQYNGVYSLVRNHIGNDFHHNLMSGVLYNVIGNDFYYNAAADEFESNAIGNGFTYNDVGNQFKYNTVGNGFAKVTAGDNFKYNAVLDWRPDASPMNLSGVPELHGKNYTHVLQLNSMSGYTVTWYSNQLNVAMVTV
jgi:hypothetical protein